MQTPAPRSDAAAANASVSARLRSPRAGVMPETTAKRAPSSSAGSKPSSAAKAEARRSYQTVVGRGGTPSSAKKTPSRPSGAQATPLRSTPAAVSSAATRAPSGLSGSAPIQRVATPSRASPAATFVSEPATWTSSAMACSRRAGAAAVSRSIASPSVTTRALTSVALHRQPAVHHELGAGHERRLVREQEDDAVGHLRRIRDALDGIGVLHRAPRRGGVVGEIERALDHRGQHVPGAHDVAADPVARVVDRDHPREPHQAGLGGGVGGEVRIADQADDRSGVDDAPAAGLAHREHGLLAAVEGAL